MNAQDNSALAMNGMNFRTVSTPGFFVSPRRILVNVGNGIDASVASTCTWDSVSGLSQDRISSAEGGIWYSMTGDLTHPGKRSQPQSEKDRPYHIRMGENHARRDVRAIVWENVAAHLQATGLNRWQLALKAKVGIASITRMEEQDRDQSLSVFERVAEAIGVKLWQLFKPADEPVGLSEEALDLARDYDKCEDEDLRARAAATARQFLTMRKTAVVVPAVEPSTPEAQPSHEPESPSPQPTSPQHAHS